MKVVGLFLFLIFLSFSVLSQNTEKQQKTEIPEFKENPFEKNNKKLLNPYMIKPFQDVPEQNLYKLPGVVTPEKQLKAFIKSKDPRWGMPIVEPRIWYGSKMPIYVPDSTVNYAIKELRIGSGPGYGLKK